jgi:hypothetical protein
MGGAIATEEWAELVPVAGRFPNDEIFERLNAVGAPLCPAIADKLLRGNLNSSDDQLSTLIFKPSPLHELEPFIIGGGKARVYKTPKGNIVIPLDLWDKVLLSLRHCSVPVKTAAGQILGGFSVYAHQHLRLPVPTM